MHPTLRHLGLLAIAPLFALAAACGGGTSGDATTSQAPTRDNTKEVQEYYRTRASIPPAVQEAFERGEITQQELDKRTASDEFPRFFRQASIKDLPANLQWLDGSELPEIGSPEAVKGGTFHGFIADFPRTLRTFGPDSNDSFRSYLLDDVMMRFARRHPNETGIGPQGFHYFPGIAKAWATDPDSKQVFVRMHPEARWSDGVPITVDDVFFLFYLYQNPDIKDPWYNNWYTRNYTHVTRYDDHTFAIGIPEWKPDALARVLELEPMPAHFYKELGDDYVERYQWRFKPTSGAYVVLDKDIEKGRSIALTRNKDWWAKDLKFWRYRFNYDRIHLSVIRDTSKAFEAFRKGDLDVFGLSLPDYWYEKMPDTDPLVRSGYVAKKVFYNEIPRPNFGLWMNQSRPLLDNRDVRVGIQYATNWERVIREYFRGDYSRMRTTADGFGEFTEPTIAPRGYSVDNALDAFARAGFSRRGADGILVNDAGQRLSFTLTTGYDNLRDVLTILREEAAKAGLDLRLEVLDNTAAFKKAREKQHDIFFFAFNIFPEMYPRYWETYHSVNAYDQAFLPDGRPNPARKAKPNTNNMESVAIPELDRMIESYSAATDVEEMKRLAFAMEKMMHENASFSPGFVMPFYRIGHWRWVRWPADFNVKLSRASDEFYLGWLDPELKKEVLDARRAGRTYPASIEVHDQYRAK